MSRSSSLSLNSGLGWALIKGREADSGTTAASD